MSTKRLLQLAFLTFLVVGTVLIIRQQQSMPYQHDEGMVFGTMYHITYQSDKNLKQDIEAELKKVDQALSMFNEQSDIARINRNEDVQPGRMFTEVFRLAEKVSKETDGAFDITVAPLVNAWGFGFKEGIKPTQHKVDSLLKMVGYQKISLDDGHVRKKDPRMMLDCSAIAKGYGCDVVARMLKKCGVANLMVEIGGEVITRGVNEKREAWRIGVNAPNANNEGDSGELQAVLKLKDKALATSGNYRNFYYQDGKKYAHTIDPQTGYPVQHNILSATVLAADCATADAYATAFMVLGLEGAQRILEQHPELKAYLIYTNQKGEYAIWYSPSMKQRIIEE